MDEQPQEPERKPRKRKAKRKGKPRGIHAARKKDKTPFKYDAAPVLARHIGPGRPTDYNPFRGDELVAFMADGLSFTSASAAMGFDPDTLRAWARRYPEFSGAIKRGKACFTLYYNRKLNRSVDGPAVVASIFGLKNGAPDEWRDKHEVVNSTAPDDPLLAFLRSINGNILRPAEPPTIDGECRDVTTVTNQPQIEGPPRPFEGRAP